MDSWVFNTELTEKKERRQTEIIAYKPRDEKEVVCSTKT